MKLYKFLFVALAAQVVQVVLYKSTGLELSSGITPIISVAIALNVVGVPE